jgi:hypothetical protein
MVTIDDSLHLDKAVQRKFRQLQVSLNQYLSEKYLETDKFGFIHATPLIVAGSDNENFRIFYETFMNVVSRIVQSYGQDSQLRRMIPLPDNLRTLLKACPKEYKMGTLRPDFLVDENEEFFVNEINARFPTNGYFISHGVNYALSRMNIWKNRGFVFSERLNSVPCLVERKSANVAVFKDSEPNWDISLFEEFVTSLGKSFTYLSPKSVSVEDGRLTYNNGTLDSIVLELAQNEIADSIDLEMSKALQSHNHFNDLRTILIAHDKRLFGVFSDDKLMQRYANKDERKVIEPHIPYTHVINSQKDISTLGIEDCSHDWVLKHALLGKGKSVYIGAEMERDSWRKALDIARGGLFVAQKYVKQRQFSVYIPHLGIQQINLYGMLLGMDGKFISQGLYRGAINDPTRLWDGHIFVPFMMKKELQ